MRKLPLFTMVVLILRVAAKDAKLLRRHKRILNGLEAPDRDSGYTVSRYMVWISNQHVCTGGKDKEDSTVSCSVDYRHERCGGALLTSNIVQTAGHCISSPGPFHRIGEPSPCLRYNPYVDLDRIYYVFVGWNKVNEFKKGYRPLQYVLNQKCANLNLRNVTFTWPFPVYYDYGLIILKTHVAPYKNFEFQKLNYAPTYTIDNLEKMWRRVMSRELTCLIVGYGRTGPPNKVPHGSEMLRHGWGVIRNYLKCIRLMGIPLKTNGFNYVDDATWLCATPLPEHSDRVAGGDSGSPVTCDNEYVGLLSQTAIPDIESNEKLIMIASLAYSLFENSAEYRTILNRQMERFPPSQLLHLERPPLPTPHPAIDDFAQNLVSDVIYFYVTYNTDRVTGGDSGSPVTCDNEYIGLLSQTTLPSNESNEKLTMIAALVYSLFENSAEYRRIMIRWYERFPVSYPSFVSRPPLPTRHSVIYDFAQRSIAHASPIRTTILVCVIAVSISLI